MPAFLILYFFAGRVCCSLCIWHLTVVLCVLKCFVLFFVYPGSVTWCPGVHPMVASATSAVMILYTSFTATTSFVVFGLLQVCRNANFGTRWTWPLEEESTQYQKQVRSDELISHSCDFTVVTETTFSRWKSIPSFPPILRGNGWIYVLMLTWNMLQACYLLCGFATALRIGCCLLSGGSSPAPHLRLGLWAVVVLFSFFSSVVVLMSLVVWVMHMPYLLKHSYTSSSQASKAMS